MFTTKYMFPDNSFIREQQIGVVINEPLIQICKIFFDINYYSDSLFDLFSVNYPETLFSAGTKRKSEYLAARVAAKILFNRNRIKGDVLSNKDRSPIWPLGWDGSISHSNKCSIVAISPHNSEKKKNIIGLDIEGISSTMTSKVANSFTTLEERTLLKKIGIDYNIALLIAFSAKESFFKAIYPHIKTYFSFESVIISMLDINNKIFVLQLTRHFSDSFPIGSCYSGSYSIDKGYIITLVY